MIRGLTALCGVLTLLFAFGCGQKGPLYLPGPDPAATQDNEIPEPGEK